MGNYSNLYSSSKSFRNNSVSYTLCVTMVDVPELVSNKMDENFVKNLNALLDTSPFNNIYDESQWELIKLRIDEYDINNPQIKELSENLIFADSWSGVALLVIALMEIYGVVVELLRAESYGREEFMAMGIMGGIAILCIWAMIKGKN